MSSPQIVAISILVLFLVIFFFLHWRQQLKVKPKRSRIPIESLDLDSIASFWCRELISEGLTATRQELAKPQEPQDRIKLYRWLARWGGMTRNAALLRQALEQKPWPVHHPEREGWEIWLAHLLEGRTTPALLDRFESLFNSYGHTLGVPALRIFIMWLLEAEQPVRAWRIWVKIPEEISLRIQRHFDPCNDILLRAVPVALREGLWDDIRTMASWLQQHRPSEPIHFWIKFQIAQAMKESKPEKYLQKGIALTDHYWLYRTLESWYLENGDPRMMEAFYIQRSHESKDSLRGKVLLILHDLRIERLSRAMERLYEIEDPLSFWPPYWQWVGYAVAQLGQADVARRAWLSYWALVRQNPNDALPFQCDSCGYGTPSWWDLCPSCKRIGTLDLRMPTPSGIKVTPKPNHELVEMLENIFD